MLSMYTSLGLSIVFIRKLKLRRDITNFQENIEDLNKELGPKIAQRKILVCQLMCELL